MNFQIPRLMGFKVGIFRISPIGQKVRSRVALNIRYLERFVADIKKLYCIYAEPLPSNNERQILNSEDIVTLLITKSDE